MNSSQVTAFALSTLPPVVSEELQSLSCSGELANVMDQVDEDEEFLANVNWPASPSPLQGPLVTSTSASTPVSSSQGPQAIQNSSLSRSASQSRSQGSTLTGNPQWDLVSMEILAKAVLNRNPNHAPNNSAKASVWEPIYQEYKAALKKRREQQQLNACSTGGVETTSVIEKLIDDFIATEGVNTAAARRSLPSMPTPRHRRRFVELLVVRDRQQFAEIASNTGDGDPAARSLTTPSERASQEHSVVSESGDDRVDMQRWLGTISIDTTVMMTPRSGVSVDDDEVDGVGDKVGSVGGNSVASTRVSSVLTDAWSDPRTAVDYCLRFYLNPDRWFAMNRLRTSGSGDTTHTLR
ncbi:uncharacterized protein UHOD_11561 [Ustilago sp. UG-2017b]|nr:uncharacterized protein UHOD_11561 [Ustilago sp. UG-2017b]